MLVYIAGAYRAATQGEVLRNIGLAMDVAAEVWRSGHEVICPHTMTAPFEAYELEDEDFLRNGLAQLGRCDAVVLVQGPGLAGSEGTMEEVAWANKLGIPVYDGPGDWRENAERGMRNEGDGGDGEGKRRRRTGQVPSLRGEGHGAY